MTRRRRDDGGGYLLLLFLVLTSAAGTAASSSSSNLTNSQKSNKNSSSKIIRHLPGFHGPLPFQLQTGYVEVDATNGVHLFYYFIRSQRNPVQDPLILWLTGGPGCSALSGLVYEIGPLSFDRHAYDVDALPKLLYKPDSWTKVSNVIFLDSPVGTGYSYSKTDQGYKSSDTKAVSQIVIFLTKWFDEHPEFLSNPLYIAGDSYCGMIVPAITLQIAKGKEVGNGPALNLKGYLVGNPVTDGNFDNPAKIPFAHGMGLISDEMYQAYKDSCGAEQNSHQSVQCTNSLDVIDETAEYTMSRIWANNGTVREALGIHKGTVPSWQRCNFDIPYTSDIHSSVKHHLDVTTKGYRSLIYSGDHDMVIPFIGTQAWIRSLNFSVVDEWRPWFVDTQVAGYTRSYSNNLKFATVKGGGHTAPEYMPKQCFAMFARWVSGEPL